MGKNGIDESGKRETKFDPNSHEFITIHDDLLIWPR